MKSFRKIILLGTLLTGMFVAGCGGQNSAVEQLPRGEGNIPIGRAQNKEMGESAVTVEMADGRLFYTFTHQQVIYTPALPKGPTTVTIVPGNRRFSRYVVRYVVGPDQFWAFNARPASRVATQVVKDIDVNMEAGASFKVGDRFKLEIQVAGVDLDNVKPTVTVNGGVARIDDKDTLTFTKAGVGQINLELLGYTRSVEFSVGS